MSRTENNQIKKGENAPHIPVLMAEVLEALQPKSGETYLDGTFGFGGYSKNILEAADCNLHAIDRDPAALIRGKELSSIHGSNFKLHNGCFSDMENLLAQDNITKLDAVILDIGVSSMQIDEAERGFSFRFDGPLDMRMSQKGKTAADIINNMEEKDLADIIFHYGEERRSRAVARAIVKARTEKEITTTAELADIIRKVVRKDKSGIDPATRTFMGLRIYINDELGELKRGLAAAERLLKPKGRLIVVSFHSLEDRIVKKFLHSHSGKSANSSRHLPMALEPSNKPKPSFKLINKKPISAQKEEMRLNPRARSARLRAAIRTKAPSFPIEASPVLSWEATPNWSGEEVGS